MKFYLENQGRERSYGNAEMVFFDRDRFILHVRAAKPFLIRIENFSNRFNMSQANTVIMMHFRSEIMDDNQSGIAVFSQIRNDASPRI
jgi:predicted GTPase